MATLEDPVSLDDVMEDGHTAVAMDSASVMMIATRNRFGLVFQDGRTIVSIPFIITFVGINNIH